MHSHRFPAANTAVPFVNKDEEQMKVTERLPESGFITVDIFAVSPVDEMTERTPMVRRAERRPRSSMTGFAVGEEVGAAGPIVMREVGQVAAPIDKAAAGGRSPGSTVRVDVVVRTRKIGHFFPGGTVDAFDVWLELQGQDADGTRDLLERPGRGRRARAGGAGRALLPRAISSTARATRSTSATRGRRAACCMSG